VARKPAQSFAAGEEGTTDADLLAAATGDDPYRVCPAHRWYPTPMAPVMAAEALGRSGFTVADLVAEVDWAHPDGPPDLRLFETAGGLRSPLADDGDSLAVAAAVEPQLVVVVANAGLGTLDLCRSAAEALQRRRLPVTIVLNRYDETNDLHRRNRTWLQEREGLSADPPAAAIEALLASTAGDR
jgi:dethiobiotin synthetase